MHVALRFAYDGSAPAFPNGYARQTEGGTVEDALLAAARREGYVAGSWLTGSRTDRGVSAAENVASLQLQRPHLKGLVPALQAHLPDGVWVTGAAEVGMDWTPRYGAVREYLYVAPSHGEDLDAMQRAAQRFVGTHDMSAFAKVEAHRDPHRTVQDCRVVGTDGAWQFVVGSEGFLWNQVRRMVAAMLAVGRGAVTPADIDAALATGRPHPSFSVAPPEGLLLQSVTYAPPIAWSKDAGSLDVRRLSVVWQRNRVQSAWLAALSGSS